MTLDMRGYDPDGPYSSLRELSELYGEPIWVGWETRVVKGEKKKIPLSINGHDAKSNDPSTWSTYNRMKRRHKYIGIMLGRINDVWLVGIDLDKSRDNPVAREIIERLDSYTETSPSGEGAHVLVLAKVKDVIALGLTGREFGKGGHRGMGVYAVGRYFTVTHDHVNGSRRELRLVSLADLKWLLEVAGPKYKGDGVASPASDEDDRSAKAMGYAIRLLKDGKSIDDTRDVLLNHKGRIGEWTRTKGVANNERELDRVMEQAVWEAELEAKGVNEEWTIEHSRDFMRGFVPPDYMLDGILQRHFIYSITAQTNGGKTAFLLLLAAMIALGRGKFCGRDLQGGRVLYCAGENPDDVRMRWMAMAHRMGFDPDKIDVHFIKARPNLKKNLAEIKRRVEAIGDFVLVIIDTAAAYFKGDDENSNTEAGKYARELRELVGLRGGPTVIVACHPTKYAKDDELLPRGGGAFLFEMDGNMTCVNDGTFIKVHWLGKWRGPEFLEPINVALEKGVTAPKLIDSRGRSITTVVAEELTQKEYMERQADVYSDEDTALRALVGTPMTPTVLAQNCNWVLKNGDPHRSKAYRVLKRLVKAKFVKEFRDQYHLTSAGEQKAKKTDTLSETAQASR